jgi:hypothetical protein
MIQHNDVSYDDLQRYETNWPTFGVIVVRVVYMRTVTVFGTLFAKIVHM